MSNGEVIKNGVRVMNENGMDTEGFMSALYDSVIDNVAVAALAERLWICNDKMPEETHQLLYDWLMAQKEA